MARRPRWWHQLQASKNEALLAVDLYNRSGHERQLEAFIVHMSMAWLKLLQAAAERDGGDLYIRDHRGRRQRAHDGGWLHKSLQVMASEFFGVQDPRLANLLFFVGLRNRIEHRHERDVATLVAGRTQAWMLNYEATLTGEFGTVEGLSTQLRFPLFLSSITDDAAEALKAVRRRVPRGVLEWVQDFDAELEPDLAADQRFDFRVYLVPHTGSKTEADAAMTFVRLNELTEDQQEVMAKAQTIIRDRQVAVSDLGALLPTEVAKRVTKAIGRPFKVTPHHARAWRYFEVRPPSGSTDPAKTKTDFCRWNPAFKQYVYTDAWVKFLSRKLSDDEIYAQVMQRRHD